MGGPEVGVFSLSQGGKDVGVASLKNGVGRWVAGGKLLVKEEIVECETL